jgi:hypothetical protein
MRTLTDGALVFKVFNDSGEVYAALYHGDDMITDFGWWRTEDPAEAFERAKRRYYAGCYN